MRDKKLASWSVMKILELPPSTRVAVSLMGEMPGRKMLKKNRLHNMLSNCVRLFVCGVTSDREVSGLDLGVPSYSGLQILKYELHVQIITSVSIVSFLDAFTMIIGEVLFHIICSTAVLKCL